MKRKPARKLEPVRVTVKQTFESPSAQVSQPLDETRAPVNQQGASKLKSAWKWFWWFIWEDTSIWSWLANIALAFLIIKFLVYPALGLVLGTSHPIVAVVSGSMEHDDSFDLWWNSPNCCTAGLCKSQGELYTTYGITKEQFKRYSFVNGFNKGDLMVLTSPKKLNVGDVVVYGTSGLADPVIHRVILLTNATLETKGDHNCGQNGFEQDIQSDQLIGKASLRVPLLGWIKIGFVNLIGVMTGRA